MNALILLPLASLAAPRATTLIELTPDQVLERSSAVVVATIVDTVIWEEPANGTIHTDLVLDDLELLWSAEPGFEPTVLTFAGGELDGRGMAVAGMPEWRIGERSVLFVEGDGQSQLCPTVGWGQGLYLVADDGILEDSHGLPLGLNAAGSLVRARPSAAVRTVRIDTLDTPELEDGPRAELEDAGTELLDLDGLALHLRGRGGAR